MYNKMKVRPVPEVLSRKPNKELKKILDLYANSIDEIINFGTHLILWDINKKRDGKDYFIPSLMLRNIVELGDGISILIRKSSIDPAAIVLRSLFEATLGLLYLLEEDEKRRAHCYMVSIKKKELKLYEKFLSQQQPYKQLSSELKLDPNSLRSRIDNIQKLFKKPLFKEASEEYDSIHQKERRAPNWYYLYGGPRDIQRLAKRLDKSMEYEFIYRKLSEHVHSNGEMKALVFTGEGYANVIQIRDFEQTKDVFSYTISCLLEAFKKIVDARLEEKTVEFNGWYKQFGPRVSKIIREQQYKYKK
jgi:hypothetical protein